MLEWAICRSVSPADFTKIDIGLVWPRFPRTAMPKIISHDQAENEPTGSDRALQDATDLRLSDTRIVADWDFNHAVSSQRAFQDHFHRPAIRRFFERERA